MEKSNRFVKDAVLPIRDRHSQPGIARRLVVPKELRHPFGPLREHLERVLQTAHGVGKAERRLCDAGEVPPTGAAAGSGQCRARTRCPLVTLSQVVVPFVLQAAVVL